MIRELIEMVRLLHNEEPNLSEIIEKIGVSRATAFRQFDALRVNFGVQVKCSGGRYKIIDHGVFSPSALKIWTPADDVFLMENYPNFSARHVADQLGRTTAAIHTRANKLGIAEKGKGKKRQHRWKRRIWSVDEDQLIRDKYPGMGMKIASLLSDRTGIAVAVRARALGVKKRKNGTPG